MYRNCIFCSADLGSNEVIETFPVGRQLAFDAWKGRLWAVCPACARWNLSPIEERWESVEEADRLFRDARLRVQSENIGMAQMPDGTRLVRVGSAVPGELAAWRYGAQLLKRRKRYLIGGAAGAAGSVAIWGGVSALGAGIVGLIAVNSWLQNRYQQKVIHRVPARDGLMKSAVIRRWHLEGIGLYTAPGDDNLEVHVRDAHREKPKGWDGKVRRDSTDVLVVSGDRARALLGRAMVFVNNKGATRSTLAEANRLLANVGSADEVLRIAGSNLSALGKRAGGNSRVMKPIDALVFEMALNETAERRALEGELTALEAAWREAEEIAAIADSLPGEALMNRMLERLSR